MATPTAIIASANRNKSLSPATSLPIEEPIAAHGHFHVTGAPVADQATEGIERDGKRARADGDMRIADAGDVKEERHGEYRAAAADQAERKSDRAAGRHRQRILCPGKSNDGGSMSEHDPEKACLGLDPRSKPAFRKDYATPNIRASKGLSPKRLRSKVRTDRIACVVLSPRIATRVPMGLSLGR